MADVEVSYKGSTIGSLSATGSLTLETQGTYCEADIGISYTKPSGGGGNFTLIGTKVFSNLSEYTNTSTTEESDTEISISNTDYAFGYVVITCDTPPDSSTTWGMSVLTFGRQKNAGNINTGQATQQRGTATLSASAMSQNDTNSNAYGVWIKSNASTVIMCRKAYGSNITKLPAGNYTVKVYGMTAI